MTRRVVARYVTLFVSLFAFKSRPVATSYCDEATALDSCRPQLCRPRVAATVQDTVGARLSRASANLTHAPMSLSGRCSDGV